MKSFSLLRREIKESLSDLGFKRPSEIQELAIPKILEGRHALLIAPTGIGKTEAALLPLFHRFLEAKSKGIAILYITPLRALNRDLMERLEWWSKRLDMSIAVRHGDTTQHMRRKQALAPPEMLITTPETLQAILAGEVMRRHLRNVRFVVIDEIHELVEDKRGAQLSLALERLAEVVREGKSVEAGSVESFQSPFQRIGLSATIGSPETVAKFLAPNEPVEILKISALKETLLIVEKPQPKKEDKEIAEKVLAGLDASSRMRRMLELIRSARSTLIFANTREMAEVLASRLRLLEESVGIHHSSLSQEVRIAAEQDFKAQKLKAMICTSSLELGIDVGSVDLVMQYSSPHQITRLLQRVGRSGHRVGKRARGAVIVTDADDAIEALVIARKALAEELEELDTPPKPYDVLAHQLVGLALERRSLSRKAAFEIVRRSFVYSDLSYGEFEEVLKLLNELRLVWLEEESFSASRNSRNYYFSNLSTIPDERRYFARNFVAQQNVGVLDESFVVNYAEPGNLIIFKGAPWRVVSVEEKEVLLEPVDEITGAVPSWVGEEIPVPYSVAQEVGKLRKESAERDLEALKDYNADDYTKKFALSKIRRHRNKGIAIADDGKVVVELFENLAIIHACFGMKVNQTLGQVFSVLLTSKLGAGVAMKSDAYRIILHSSSRLKREDVEELFKIDFEFVEALLSKTLKRTSLFKWKFTHVAKRFGAISKEASYTSLSMGRIIAAYEDSIIYRETLKEIFRNNLDLKNTKEVLEGIKSGRIALEFASLKYPSPIAELGLRSYGEVVLPERAEKLILKALKNRIEDKRVEVFCMYCGGYSESFKVRNIPEDLLCRNCGAKMLAVLKGRSEELKGIYKKHRGRKALSAEERQELRRMRTSANLVLSYGKPAIIAQAGRGVGPETAKRVLLAARTEEELYRQILKAERDYARTKRFWD